MTDDLISKSALLEAIEKAQTHNTKVVDKRIIGNVVTLVDLINSAPVVSGDNNYKELFLQACRTLSECGRLLEIPEDETIGEPSELFCAIEELKEKSIQTPQPQSARDALEKAAQITWRNCMDYMKKHGIAALQNKDMPKFVSDIRALIEHDAPSAPIEGQQNYVEVGEVVRKTELSPHGNPMNIIDVNIYSSNDLSIVGTKIYALIPSTQAPKE